MLKRIAIKVGAEDGTATPLPESAAGEKERRSERFKNRIDDAAEQQSETLSQITFKSKRRRD